MVSRRTGNPGDIAILNRQTGRGEAIVQLIARFHSAPTVSVCSNSHINGTFTLAAGAIRGQAVSGERLSLVIRPSPPPRALIHAGITGFFIEPCKRLLPPVPDAVMS